MNTYSLAQEHRPPARSNLDLQQRPSCLCTSIMSLNSPSSSQFQAIFKAALKEYSQKTGKDIVTNPITAKLRRCSSPDEVLDVLQEKAQAFNDFRDGDRRVQLMRKLKPTVGILLALSTNEVLGNIIGSVSARV